MKRLIFPASAAAVAAIALGTAGHAGGTPAADRLVGTGKRLNLAGVPITIHVNAMSGQAGENASGAFWTMRGTPADSEFSGRITCLTVDGNRAAAKGVVEVSTDPINPVGSEFQIQITDNGPPGHAVDTNINFSGFAPGDGCPEFFTFSEIPLDSGNFEVTDR